MQLHVKKLIVRFKRWYLCSCLDKVGEHRSLHKLLQKRALFGGFMVVKKLPCIQDLTHFIIRLLLIWRNLIQINIHPYYPFFEFNDIYQKFLVFGHKRADKFKKSISDIIRIKRTNWNIFSLKWIIKGNILLLQKSFNFLNWKV